MISAERIPNNVGLSSNKRLQRALEHWQPKYIQWWRDMGPQGFQDYHQVYVRTAISVDPEGWAHFEYVKLPEYRWGIFLADPVHDRRIGFGAFFGRDGRDEAEELLERQSGNRDKPRILEAFNEPIDNWLDFFMFTMFTDRDGKSQLMSLSESSLDPLSRTTRFMLTEEAHHMFVGETGIARILERTCQLMTQAGYSEDVRKVGGIDIPTIQKHLNQWFSLSLDLHGGEVSSNAASYFANGLKGRAKEDTFDEHIAMYSGFYFDPNGVAMEKDAWEKRRYDWLPWAADTEYLLSIMDKPVY